MCDRTGVRRAHMTHQRPNDKPQLIEQASRKISNAREARRNLLDQQATVEAGVGA
jgi:hypothetical protein